MATDPTSFVEWGRNIGLTGVCAGLVYVLKWSIGMILKGKDDHLSSMLKAKDEVISELRADLEKVKAQRDAARDQLFVEKDKNAERYHRLATQVSEVNQETGRWLEYVARPEGGRGRQGGGRPPPASPRNRPHAEANEGGEGT